MKALGARVSFAELSGPPAGNPRRRTLRWGDLRLRLSPRLPMLLPPLLPPLLGALTAVDFAVLALYMLVMLAIGFYFAGKQGTTQDFFLAGRSLGWFPLGMSLMATLISALSYTAVPAQGYSVGWKVLAVPVAIWLTTPLVLTFVAPLFRNLQLFSIYEYLELRFDARTRLAATVLFALWRLLWLGGVIYAPCKAFALSSGWNWPDWVLIVVLGGVATVYTFLGGMKAVVWTDVIQGLTMLFGIGVIVVGVWLQVDGGAERVWEVTAGLGRASAADLKFDLKSTWSLWGFLPHYTLAMLSFYLADQITAQRFLSAKDVPAARRSFLANCVALSLLYPGLTYVGLCLLTYYHDHPQDLRPNWVANQVERGAHAAGLLDPENPAHELTTENLPQLVREQRILRPNLPEPFEDVAEFTDAATGAIEIEKLATRRPNQGKFRGEVYLTKRAGEELLPQFIARHLAPGIAGLILAALLAASMSSIDSGLNAIVTLIIKDFHERFGWGERWLAKRLQKEPGQLSDADRLHLAQPLTLVIGVTAMAFGMIVSQFENVFDIMLGVVNTFGAPLLAVFLLGIFTKRATAPAAFAALLVGTAFTTGLLQWLQWSTAPVMDKVWVITLGTGFTFVVGYVLSYVVGRPLSAAELRGLVWGLGEPGIRTAGKSSTTAVTTPENGEGRWR